MHCTTSIAPTLSFEVAHWRQASKDGPDLFVWTCVGLPVAVRVNKCVRVNESNVFDGWGERVGVRESECVVSSRTAMDLHHVAI